MKLLFPQRNPNNATLRRSAIKLDRLGQCPMVVRYLHAETIEHRGHPVGCLVSELVEGPRLSSHLSGLPNRRMAAFEALSLVHALSLGLEQIHLAGEYHGDRHDGNVFIERRGIHFRPRVFDFFDRGRAVRAYQSDDVVDPGPPALRRGRGRRDLPRPTALHQGRLHGSAQRPRSPQLPHRGPPPPAPRVLRLAFGVLIGVKRKAGGLHGPAGALSLCL